MKPNSALYALAILFCVVIVTSGCDQSTKKRNQTAVVDTAVQQTVQQLLAKKPKFNGFEPYILYNSSDTMFVRIVSNSEILQKVWFVYFDHNNRSWEVKSWQGAGTGNKVLKDTALYIKKYDQDLSKSTEIYMAFSEDGGKTWKSNHVAAAALTCIADPNSKNNLQNHVQLILSADYTIKEHSPSLAVLLQQRNPIALKTTGIVNGVTFENFCPVKRDLARN